MEQQFMLIVKNFDTDCGTITFLRNSARSSKIEHVLPKCDMFLRNAAHSSKIQNVSPNWNMFLQELGMQP